MADFAALPLFTDALIADTQHLDDEEFGRYMRLLIVCWRSPQCRMPNDPAWICKRLRVETLRYDSVVKPLIEEFFSHDADADADAYKWITQKRLKKEWKYTFEKREKNKAAAKSRWDKEKRSCKRISKRNAPSPSPSPTPTKTPLPPKGGTGFNSGFSEEGTFNIERCLSDRDRDAARKAAPGWDMNGYLIPTYNERINSGESPPPDKPAAAFIGWCRSYTKGKPP